MWKNGRRRLKSPWNGVILVSVWETRVLAGEQYPQLTSQDCREEKGLCWELDESPSCRSPAKTLTAFCLFPKDL